MRKARIVARGLLPAALLLALALGDAGGQSQWKPVLRDRAPKPRIDPNLDIPPIRVRDPIERPDWILPSRVPLDTSQVGSPLSWDRLQSESFRSMWVGPPLRMRIRPMFDLRNSHEAGRGMDHRALVVREAREAPGSAGAGSGLPTPSPATFSDVRMDGWLQLDVQLLTSYAFLSRFNDSFLGHELALDGRNHEDVHWSRGWSAQCRLRDRTERELVLGYERDDFLSRDRETWLMQDSQSGTVLAVRDQQEVRIETHTGRVGFARPLLSRQARLALEGGLEVYATRVAVEYSFDGQEQYEFRTDACWAAALFGGLHLTAPVRNPWVVTLSAGGRIGPNVENIESDGMKWYWLGKGGTKSACLNPSGFYGRIGLGVLI